MFIEVPYLSLRFIDSLNFLQMPLKAFPKMFGLMELKKGYFPHYFNKPCNWEYVGNVPSKVHYGYNQMRSNERKNFLKWYDALMQKGYIFNYKEEILQYCRSDVDILRRSIMKLRKDFIDLDEIDPLRYITIASVCMALYRSKYMPANTIAIVSENSEKDRYSKSSICWLNWLCRKNDINIRHALNGGEEVLKINGKSYKVDSFHNKSNTVYEFYGCFWHRCLRCFKPDAVNIKNQKDMKTLNQRMLKKRKVIERAGYNHVSIYECQLKSNEAYRAFAKENLCNVVEPLKPRDAFYGGRMNTTKLLYSFKGNEVGRYVDFCSLYPTVQYYNPYPIGHPMKIFNPKGYDSSWHGFIKCKVLAPTNLYHPVLPQRIKTKNYEKLMFILCRTCDESESQKE